jgi:hypothetical protein
VRDLRYSPRAHRGRSKERETGCAVSALCDITRLSSRHLLSAHSQGSRRIGLISTLRAAFPSITRIEFSAFGETARAESITSPFTVEYYMFVHRQCIHVRFAIPAGFGDIVKRNQGDATKWNIYDVFCHSPRTYAVELTWLWFVKCDTAERRGNKYKCIFYNIFWPVKWQENVYNVSHACLRIRILLQVEISSYVYIYERGLKVGLEKLKTGNRFCGRKGLSAILHFWSSLKKW